MPKPVYVAVWPLETTLDSTGIGHNIPALVAANQALPDVAPTQKAVTIGNKITATYTYLVQEATAQAEQNDALYIFLGTEYVLQTSYAMRTMKQTTKEQVLAHLIGVSNACQGMLIVPGTILWRQKKGIVKAYNQEAADAFNSAFAFWNGNVKFRHDKHQDVAEIKDTDLKKTTPDGEHDRAKFKKGVGSGRFSIGDIDYGIEICGDHLHATLAQSGPQVDVHLLTSATVTHDFANHIDRIAARDGGIFIHCDETGARVASTQVGAWEINRPNVTAGTVLNNPPQGISAYRVVIN